MKLPLVGFLFRDAKVIPIASRKENADVLDKAYLEIEKALEAGDIICLFPEGQITHDGNLAPFKSGVERILSKNSVPVIPMTISGLWGSFFSRAYNGSALSQPSVIFKRVFGKVELEVFKPWQPEDVTAQKLEEFFHRKLS